MFRSLKSPSYRVYFCASLGQIAGMSMQNVSSPYLIFHLTNSAALLGTMSLVGAIPMIIVSLYGGALADRIPKRTLLLWGLGGMALSSLVIALALLTNWLNSKNPASWSILFVMTAIQGALTGMLMPAIQAIIPELVGRQELMNAIAVNSVGMTILNLLAPLAAGYIIGENANYEAVYFIVTGCNILATIFVLFLPRKQAIVATTTKIMTDIRKGFVYITQDSLVLRILLFTLIIVVLAMPFQQLLPIFTDNILKVGPPGMGLLMSILGVGSLVSSIYLTAMPGKKRGLLLFSGGLITGGALLVFSFSAIMGLSMAMMFLVGMGQTLRNTIGGTLLQTYTENAYMGRVMALNNMQWGVMSIFTFFAGILAEHVPVQWVLGSLSILLAMLSVLLLSIWKNVRQVN